MIACRDGCGTEGEPNLEGLVPGWTLLGVAGGQRCGACVRALEAAGRLIGPDGETPDTLPPDSRGALPRETASTIAAPARGLA